MSSSRYRLVIISSSCNRPASYSLANRGTSTLGLHDPYTVPTMLLFHRMNSCRLIAMDCCALRGHPGQHAGAALADQCEIRVDVVTGNQRRGDHNAVRHHPVGQVTDQVGGVGHGGHAVRGAERIADFCFSSTGSTATICAAPLMRAPWIAPVPMPPAPTTTTVSPLRTRARFSAEP